MNDLLGESRNSREAMPERNKKGRVKIGPAFHSIIIEKNY
jgi:hypothetical protein